MPGLGKTLALSTVARTMDLDFSRVSFTPDLLPSDIIGGQIYHQAKSEFFTKKGPIFTNFLLADEINRAPAKVQSALLEAMQERRVTIADETFSLSDPFMVLATQNPVEQDGTYALPEAQQDRFLFKTLVGYPTREEEIAIMSEGDSDFPSVERVLDRQTLLDMQRFLREHIYIHDSIREYVADIVFATRGQGDAGMRVASLIRLGASPRAGIAFLSGARALAFLEGRDYVIPEDIKELAPEILRHRIHRSFDAIADEISIEEIIVRVLDSVVVP